MSNGAVETLGFCGGVALNVTDAPASAVVGTTLDGAYRITRPIGEGGMGAVYESVQVRLNKRVAVKVMARELALNAEALGRFQREAEITSHLRHPHLVTVMDFGTAPTGQPYLVMEYLEGADLAQRIAQLGRLRLETAVHITTQIASALAAAHDQGVVHRDLKPANVFLVSLPHEPDFVKILDFGISKVKAARTQLTGASSIIGTPDYMSPEQATGLLDEIDHRTDQWALACIVWEMLSGRPPFAGDDVSAVLYQVIHLDPRPLGKRAPGLAPAVEAVLRRALSKSMADRYPSIRDFAHALELAALARPDGQARSGRAAPCGAPRTERRVSHRERRRSKQFKPIYALSAAVLVLAVALLFLGRAKSPAQAGAPALVAVPVATESPSTMPPGRTIVAPNEVAAVVAPVGGKPKAKKAGRQVRHHPEDVATAVADSADPFAPVRLASKQKAGRAGKADVDFVDPFAP